MGELLEVRTFHSEVSDVVDDLAANVDDGSIVLSTEASPPPGDWVQFVVALRDATPVLEGLGRCVGSTPAEDGAGGFDVLLEQLQFDTRNEIMFERILLARDALAGVGPATGVIDLSKMTAPVPAISRASKPPALGARASASPPKPRLPGAPRPQRTPSIQPANITAKSSGAPPPLSRSSRRPPPRSLAPREVATAPPPRQRMTPAPAARASASPPPAKSAVPARSSRPIPSKSFGPVPGAASSSRPATPSGESKAPKPLPNVLQPMRQRALAAPPTPDVELFDDAQGFVDPEATVAGAPLPGPLPEEPTVARDVLSEEDEDLGLPPLESSKTMVVPEGASAMLPPPSDVLSEKPFIPDPQPELPPRAEASAPIPLSTRAPAPLPLTAPKSSLPQIAEPVSKAPKATLPLRSEPAPSAPPRKRKQSAPLPGAKRAQGAWGDNTAVSGGQHAGPFGEPVAPKERFIPSEPPPSEELAETGELPPAEALAPERTVTEAVQLLGHPPESAAESTSESHAGISRSADRHSADPRSADPRSADPHPAKDDIFGEGSRDETHSAPDLVSHPAPASDASSDSSPNAGPGDQTAAIDHVSESVPDAPDIVAHTEVTAARPAVVAMLSKKATPSEPAAPIANTEPPAPSPSSLPESLQPHATSTTAQVPLALRDRAARLSARVHSASLIPQDDTDAVIELALRIGIAALEAQHES